MALCTSLFLWALQIDVTVDPSTAGMADLESCAAAREVDACSSASKMLRNPFLCVSWDLLPTRQYSVH